MCLLLWRGRRDLNSRAGYPTYTLSRGASSPLEYFRIGDDKTDISSKKKWRRERDSNPCGIAP